MKRCLDLLGASLALIVFSPFLAAVALLILWDSPGPVFYRGRRTGRGGRAFHIYKFRSMVVDAEKLGGPTTAEDDPRVTRIGRVLRRYKLDELPQLFNVVKGEMSWVGPRPEVVEKVARYSGKERRILNLRPGITDWASIWNADEGAELAGCRNADEAYECFIRPTKIRLQLLYCEQTSLWVDAKIVFYTLIKLLDKNWLPVELADLERPVVAQSARSRPVPTQGAPAQGR